MQLIIIVIYLRIHRTSILFDLLLFDLKLLIFVVLTPTRVFSSTLDFFFLDGLECSGWCDLYHRLVRRCVPQISKSISCSHPLVLGISFLWHQTIFDEWLLRWSFLR